MKKGGTDISDENVAKIAEQATKLLYSTIEPIAKVQNSIYVARNIK